MSKTQIFTTAMVLEDLDEVIQIEQDSFPHPWSRKSFQGEILTNRFAYYVVAKDTGGLVMGYAGLWVLYGEAHITTIAVKPSCRNKGIGSRLMACLLGKAEGKGADKAFLEVRDSNLVARRIYERFGFEVIGKRKNYYVDEDALIMIRFSGKAKE